MERYIGGDVHAASVTFSIRSEGGKVLRRDVVETNGQALVGYMAQQPGNVHLCIEEGEWSQWLHEILSPHVAELVVYRARWTPGSKSDQHDADDLSERIRTGKVGCPVFKDRKQFAVLREAARSYGMLTRDQARVKSRIKSFYRSRGVACSGDGVYKPEERDAQVCRLPAAHQPTVALLGRELDALVALQAEAEKTLIRESHRHPISRTLETAPGLGPKRTAQLIPIVVTPWRFRTKKQFWSYCGFGIVTRSSSDWIQVNGKWMKAQVQQTRGLSFSYNRQLKWIFKGAATTVIAHSGANPLREHYDWLLENGTKPNLAKLTIARRIAAIVLAMWKAKERYDPGRVQVPDKD
jgi:transposase